MKKEENENHQESILKLIKDYTPEMDDTKLADSTTGWLNDEIESDALMTGNELKSLFRRNDNGLNKIVVHLAQNLAGRQEDELIEIINFSARMRRVFWHLEALAVAELAARVPKNKGGAGKTVEDKDSREVILKELADKLKIGISKLREMIRIVNIFADVDEALPKKTPTRGVGVLRRSRVDKDHISIGPPVGRDGEVFIGKLEKDAAGEKFISTAVEIRPETDLRKSFKFDPRGLEIGFYKAAMRFEKNRDYARKMIDKAVEKRKTNPSFSIKDFEKMLNTDLESYNRLAKIKKNSEFDTFKIELNFSAKEAKKLDELIELELGFSLLAEGKSEENEKKFREKGIKSIIKAIEDRVNYLKKVEDIGK